MATTKRLWTANRLQVPKTPPGKLDNNVDARQSDLLELAGKILAVVAVLLPVCGFVQRLVAFSVALQSNADAAIAWSAPLPQLAFTGFFSVMLTPLVLFAPLMPLLTPRLERMWVLVLRNLQPLDSKTIQIGCVVSLLVGAGFYVLFYWSFVLALTVIVASSLLVLALRRAITHYEHVPILRLWWVLLVYLGMLSIVGGLYGRLPGVNRETYSFDPSVAAVAQDGEYARLGEDDKMLILMRCADRRVLTVNKDRVEMTTLMDQGSRPLLFYPPSPFSTGDGTLWGVLHGRALPLGATLC